MGQYYRAIILFARRDGTTTKEVIRLWLSPYDYPDCFSKLMEHSYQGDEFVTAFEFLLTPEGPAHMSRCVWAGDYADKEPDDRARDAASDDDEEEEEDSDVGDEEGCRNLYEMADDDTRVRPPARSTDAYRYIVNHSKGQYVDKSRLGEEPNGWRIHPLPLLIAEGNGRGGGDFCGRDADMVGAWARDVISVEKTVPAGFAELEVGFTERGCRVTLSHV
ncbi:hypothetical protein Pelo_8487 [Pelomyxa schiedti]|nr:hypothetical protein Pelo_8487 [Pelomyxa schiedti]